MSLFRIHAPILDDIRSDGLMPTLIAKTDEVVTRLTAGLNVEEIRSVLRGDPPKRPNPRVKPHADGFWMHMRPTYFHEKVMTLYPTFRLGWLSVYFLVFETITGLVLMLWYTPSPLRAFEDMQNIMSNVPLGLMMRDLHRLGAEFMVMVVLLHMLRTFITGSYKKPRQFTWFTGGVLLLLTLFLSFSGYLLPWDQLSLWAVTIGASMAEATPVIGREVNLLVRGGPDFGANGLLRFYLLHVFALPLIAFIFLGVHYYKVIIHGHSLPPKEEEIGVDTARKVPMEKRSYFLPDVLTKEIYWVVIWTALLILMVTVGNWHAPLEPHADSQVTPLHTTAPWYFLWLQGMLKLGDKVFWGVIAPGILVNFVFVMPYLEVGPSRRYIHRRVGLSICAISIIAFSALTYMGTPYHAVSSSPDQEVVAALVPQTHPGPVRTASYDELIPGEYSSDEWNSAPTENLREIMETFDYEINKYGGELPGAVGIMNIVDWKVGLKKVTLSVVWNNGEDTFTQNVYVHEDSKHGH